MIARLIDDGVCVGIKYAVVRDDPARDVYPPARAVGRVNQISRRIEQREIKQSQGRRVIARVAKFHHEDRLAANGLSQ